MLAPVIVQTELSSRLEHSCAHKCPVLVSAPGCSGLLTKCVYTRQCSDAAGAIQCMSGGDAGGEAGQKGDMWEEWGEENSVAASANPEQPSKGKEVARPQDCPECADGEQPGTTRGLCG